MLVLSRGGDPLIALRRVSTDGQSLVEGIACLIAEWGRAEGLRVEFERDIPLDRMASVVQAEIFRIIHEALTNVKRHSRSKTARIRLWQSDGALLLEIEDWGAGFDPNEVPPGRFGLKRIRERARLFGGRASIQSAPGQGTRILVELPGIEARHKPTAV
jgi:signal transduction histidine kinase